ncbi:unnamed protein product [Caenorhabditis nigoni]
MSYYPPPPSNYPYPDFPYNLPPNPPFAPINGFPMDQGFQGFPPPPPLPPMDSFAGGPQNPGFSNPEALQATRFLPHHPGFQIQENHQNPEIQEIPRDVTLQKCNQCKDLKSEIQELKELSEQNLDNVRNALFEEANASKEKDTVIENLIEDRDSLQLELQAAGKASNELFSSQQTVIKNLEEKLEERIRVGGKKSKSSGSSDSEKLKIEIKNANAGLRRQSDLMEISKKEKFELKRKLEERNMAVKRLEESLISVKEELQEQSDRNKSLEKYMNSQVPSEDSTKIAEIEARNSELLKELETMRRISYDQAPPAKVRKLKK